MFGGTLHAATGLEEGGGFRGGAGEGLDVVACGAVGVS